MAMLNVFSGDGFGLVALTEAVNKMPFIPGRIGSMRIFTEKGVSTTSVGIEEKSGSLSLVQTSPRGAPAEQNTAGKRTLRTLRVPHIEVEDKILADEVQNVRAFGSESAAQGVQSVVNDRMAEMSANLDATLENLRVGAIKGIVTDADGSTLYNLFTEFGLSQYNEIDFDLDNATPVSGAMKKKCNEVKREIAKQLGSAPYTGVHALCGDAFWDDLVTHPEVMDAYHRQQESAFLRQGGLAYEQFTYGGITWENYQGYIGATPYIGTDKVHLFPVGVPGLFQMYFAPADFVETVNTIGLPKYAKMAQDAEYGRFVKIMVQSNPLPICTRPAVLLKGKRT